MAQHVFAPLNARARKCGLVGAPGASRKSTKALKKSISVPGERLHRGVQAGVSRSLCATPWKTGTGARRQANIGEVSERFKEHAWKVCVRHKRTKGSNPFLSAIYKRLSCHPWRSHFALLDPGPTLRGRAFGGANAC